MMRFSASVIRRLLRLQLGHADGLLVAPGGEDGRLVDQVLQVCPDKARGALGDHAQVHFLGDGLAARVHLEDGLAPAHVGPIEDNPPVEASRPHQGRVEDVRPVGGGHDDHVGVGVEPVHLHQDLVEGLLALVVGSAQAGAALAADRVDLVHEHDAGRVALGLLEQVAHPAGAHAHEHLDELRAADREERHPRLARDGLGQEGLAGAGRADQEDALGDARAKRDELLRLLEELHHLAQFLLGFVRPGHVGEGDGRLVAGKHAGLAFAEHHGLVVGSLHLAHHEIQQAADQ
jgi:hypothetical protein